MDKIRRVDKNWFDYINIGFMLLICFITLYPLWYTVVLSFNEGLDALHGGIYWWPRKFTLENYEAVFRDSSIINAFGISTARTVVTTSLHVIVTAMFAYAVSKKRLYMRNLYLTLGTITMFFSGGLIPSFLLINRLGLYDTFWVFVIPGLFSFYNAIIFQTFFRTIPDSIEESATIDGANDLTIFFKIILPLSKPVLATIALFVGVGNWNDYFAGIVYIDNPKLVPIQTHLFRVISETQASAIAVEAGVDASQVQTLTSQAVKLATMVVATAPIMCIYPFLQKYFVKGIMIGSIKG